MTVLDQFDIESDSALVTGAASGIGAAYAETMAEAGADVILVDIDEDALSETADELASETEANVLNVVADVTQKDDCERMIERVTAEFGSLDVCFANAGVSGMGNKLTKLSTEEWDDVMSVNLRGTFLTAQKAGRVMEDQGHGRIVVTASMLGLVGEAAIGLAPYVASKGGAVQLTKQLAAELGPQVRANAVAPGYVRTGLGHGLLSETAAQSAAIEDLQDELAERAPLERLADPSELKGIALFLASEASSFCTGATFVVDGGWTAI